MLRSWELGLQHMNLGQSQVSTLKERVAEGGGKVPPKLLAGEVLPAIPKQPPTCRAPSGALVCVGLCGFGGWASLCGYRDLVSSNPSLGDFFLHLTSHLKGQAWDCRLASRKTGLPWSPSTPSPKQTGSVRAGAPFPH